MIFFRLHLQQTYMMIPIIETITSVPPAPITRYIIGFPDDEDAELYSIVEFKVLFVST